MITLILFPFLMLYSCISTKATEGENLFTHCGVFHIMVCKNHDYSTVLIGINIFRSEYQIIAEHENVKERLGSCQCVACVPPVFLWLSPPALPSSLTLHTVNVKAELHLSALQPLCFSGWFTLC